jgi:N6-adenosine-specific RNA methylase IME4
MAAQAALPLLEAEARKRTGGRPKRGEKPGPKMDGVPGRSDAQAGKLFGVGRAYVAQAKVIAKASKTLAEEVRVGKKTISQARRELSKAKEIKRIAKLEPTKGQYSVIVADPPWPYTARQSDPTHGGAPPYPIMTIEDISALHVPSARDCILWLWTTNHFMEEAFQVLRAWGFQKKTILTWVKDRIGVGDWLRGKTEHCILATKGKPVVDLKDQTTVLYGKARGHSTKPVEFFTLVGELCPYRDRIELFSRSKRDGWEVWGSGIGAASAAATSGAA